MKKSIYKSTEDEDEKPLREAILKVVVVGDPCSGKTSLISTFKNDQFPEFRQSVREMTSVIVDREDDKVLLNIYDTVSLD